MSDIWNTFYTGTHNDIVIANQQIDSNCNFPDSDTTTWAIPQQAYQQDFWFILMPFPDGYRSSIGSWTQEQMIAGVVNVEMQQSDPSWWPPE